MKPAKHRLGWIGTGRMGYALVTRLLERGCDVTVHNRTRAKAEPLVVLGARLVDRPADLADRDIVFTSVAGSQDFAAVTNRPGRRAVRWRCGASSGDRHVDRVDGCVGGGSREGRGVGLRSSRRPGQR
jgi:3-hydroxyisobutyrate dehydrogenase and related beta-hydroxyacid dehydrogenases